MTGSKNGVIQKLRDELDRQFILGVHCSAHRLELACKEACKSINLYVKVSQLMENLYLFYRNSSLKFSGRKSSTRLLSVSPSDLRKMRTF